MLFRDGTEIIEAESIYTHLVPTCSKMLKAGHITVIKNSDTDNNVADILIRAGYKVTSIELDKRVLFSYDAIRAKILSEDCKLVVAIGEDYAIESGKVIAALHSLPALLIPTDFSALCAIQKRAEFFAEKGELTNYLPKEPAVIMLCSGLLSMQPPRKLAYGLGYILSYLVWAFDTLYENLICSKKMDTKIITLISKITKFCKDLNTLELNLTAKNIMDTCIEVSKATNTYEIRSISANTLAWLISLYKKEKISYTNYVFLASFSIMEIYRHIRLMDNILTTDRNKSLQDLYQYCGLDYSTLLAKTTIGYDKSHSKRCYITLDYINELQALIEGDWLSKIATYYRRLTGSSGYDLKGLITSEEMLMLTRISGEACTGYPLLKHLQLSGLLEKYI